MKTILLSLLLTGCATVPDEIRVKCEAGGGCMTLRSVIEAMQKAWDDGYSKGYSKGEDDAPPSCKRLI